MLRTRCEPRLMPVSERALPRMRGEVSAKPLLLRGPCGHADIVVQRDQMPRADIERVVALPALPSRTGLHSRPIEVVEVPRRARRVIVVVAGRRTGLGLERSPRRLVPRLVIPERPVRVGVVA